MLFKVTLNKHQAKQHQGYLQHKIIYKVNIHRAANKLNSAHSFVRSKHAELTNALNKVNYLRQRLNSVCHIKHCG